MRERRPLVTRDTLAKLGPDPAARFVRLGLKATVCMPLVKEGRLAALMAVHTAEPPDWTRDELALVEETSGRFDYRVVEAHLAFYRQTGLPEAILGRWLRKAASALEEHWYETYGRVTRSGGPARLEQGSDRALVRRLRLPRGTADGGRQGHHGASRQAARGVPGRTDAETIGDPEQARAIMETDRRIMETGVAEQPEEPMSLADGTLAVWFSTKAPLRDAENRVVGLIGRPHCANPASRRRQGVGHASGLASAPEVPVGTPPWSARPGRTSP